MKLRPKSKALPYRATNTPDVRTIALRSSPLMPVERGAADIPIELKPRGGWGGGGLKREAFPIKCKHRVKKRVRTRNRTNFFLLPSSHPPPPPFSLHLINEFGFEISTSDADISLESQSHSLFLSLFPFHPSRYIHSFEKTSAIHHLMPFNLRSDKRKVIRAEMAAICN